MGIVEIKTGLESQNNSHCQVKFSSVQLVHRILDISNQLTKKNMVIITKQNIHFPADVFNFLPFFFLLYTEYHDSGALVRILTFMYKMQGIFCDDSFLSKMA